MEKFSSNLLPKLRTPIFFCFAGWLLLTSSPAHACECGELPLMARIKLFNAIFEAKILDGKFEFPYWSEIEPEWIENYPENEATIKRQMATLSVIKMWKGNFQKQLIFRSEHPSSCGIFLPVGQQYLFYGSQKGNHVEISLCSRMVSLKYAEVEREVLDKVIQGATWKTIQDHLLEVLDSKREPIVRVHAAFILVDEWNKQKELLDLLNDRQQMADYLPKGWTYKKLSRYAKVAQKRLSKDPNPEIRKYSVRLYNIFQISKEKQFKSLLKHLKDNSAIVRQAAATELMWLNPKNSEIVFHLMNLVENERSIEDPIERKAQGEMVQDLLAFMVRHGSESTKQWIFSFILKSFDSESHWAQNLMIENARIFEALNKEQSKQVLNALWKEFNKLKSSSPIASSETADQGKLYRWTRKYKSLTSSLIRYGKKEDKQNLLPDILKNLDSAHYEIQLHSLNILDKLPPADEQQKREIRSAILSIIAKEKQLANTDPKQWDVHRKRVQEMIAYLIEQRDPEDIRKWVPESLLEFEVTKDIISYLNKQRINDDVEPLLPEIMTDFKNDYGALHYQAYLNLSKLKPLDNGLLEQLEEIHRNADPRSKKRIETQINQLKES